MTARALWYAEGLRWIGSLFHSAADHLEQPSLELTAGEATPADSGTDHLFAVTSDPLARLL